ncbi:MAG TPA: TonB-dependent receptor [Chitinophagaceae bacterium]|nr:TonB-dependent receptor [Chitinophagaceae bacterium]
MRGLFLLLLGVAVLAGPGGLLAQPTLVRYTGVVLDYDTHLPVAGVTVQAYNKQFQTLTDSAGNFALSLPVDQYDLVFTHVAYQRLQTPIYVLDKTTGTFFLKHNPVYELQEVVVESRRRDAAVRDLQMGNVRINLSQLKKTPLVLGEADILRALTLQPGIVSGGETVSSYYVRGGSADQNLILLDGAPVFNVAHLLGFYSGINADAIQNLEFYKAGMPAEYGGRLSSIMLLNARSGNTDTFRYSGGVGLVSSRLLANGPLIRKKLTVMAAGRIAYPKLMMNLGPEDVRRSDAFYYDGILKLSYIPDDRNRVNLTLYNSDDRYRFPGDTSYAWRNLLGSLVWRSSLGKRWSLSLSGNASTYRSYIQGLSPFYTYRLASSIRQQEGKLVLTYAIAPNQKLSWGTGLVRYRIEPGSLTPTGTSFIVPDQVQPENAREWSGFLSTENRITRFLDIQFGARFTRYDYLGPRSQYTYAPGEPRTLESITDTLSFTKGQTIRSYQGAEPRLLLRILLDPATSLKLSYNRTRQYLHLITNTTSVTPVDYWKLSDTYLEPETADQYAAGLYRNFMDNQFETSVEGYYKRIDHSIEYKNGASLSLNPALETQVLPSRGYGYGVELSVRKTTGLLTGNLSYTYARTYTQVLAAFIKEQVNGGAYFPGNADRPHNFVLATSLKLGRGWEFASNFVYTSGRPATYPDGSYFINGGIVTNYSVRNEDRLPAYHRLDVSFSYDTRRFLQQRRYSVVNFSFYNVYMHRNVYSLYFKRDGSRIHAYQLSVIGSIIPSISWNFNF